MLNKQTSKILITSFIIYLLILPLIFYTHLLWPLSIVVYFANFINLFLAFKLKSKLLIILSIISIILSQGIAIFDSYIFNRTDKGYPVNQFELNISYTIFSIIIYICLLTFVFNIKLSKKLN
jgi:hypothetical protein